MFIFIPVVLFYFIQSVILFFATYFPLYCCVTCEFLPRGINKGTPYLICYMIIIIIPVHYVKRSRLCETSLTGKYSDMDGNLQMIRSTGLARSQEPLFSDDLMVSECIGSHGHTQPSESGLAKNVYSYKEFDSSLQCYWSARTTKTEQIR